MISTVILRPSTASKHIKFSIRHILKQKSCPNACLSPDSWHVRKNLLMSAASWLTVSSGQNSGPHGKSRDFLVPASFSIQHVFWSELPTRTEVSLYKFKPFCGGFKWVCYLAQWKRLLAYMHIRRKYWGRLWNSHTITLIYSGCFTASENSILSYSWNILEQFAHTWYKIQKYTLQFFIYFLLNILQNVSGLNGKDISILGLIL